MLSPPTSAPDTSKVAIVVAGAGARGAYEAGALSILLPWLEEQGITPTIFVGTSAGAINASLLAATIDQGAKAAAAALLDFWKHVRIQEIIKAPLLSGPKTIATYLGQVAGIRGVSVPSVLDTTPMLDFASGIFEPLQAGLRRNLATGTVKALALAATDEDERTTVFSDLAPGVRVPETNLGRAIDYEPTEVDYRHVLASSAIPALFLPIEIEERWYCDGGVRLNAPIAPAVALGATAVVVVATHPSVYPAVAPTRKRPAPDVIDAISGILGSALADRMVEDLLTLDKLNRVVACGGETEESRRIARLFVGPQTRHQLGHLAAKEFDRRDRRGLDFLFDDLGLVHRLLGPKEHGTGEILSYLFFDPAFTAPAIALGRRHARNQLRAGSPWVG